MNLKSYYKGFNHSSHKSKAHRELIFLMTIFEIPNQIIIIIIIIINLFLYFTENIV